MIRKLNRIVQDFFRPIRLAIGKKIWDKKNRKNLELIKDGKLDMEKVKSIILALLHHKANLNLMKQHSKKKS